MNDTPIYQNVADGTTPEPTHTPNRGITSPAVRLWLYGIITALVPLLITIGVVTAEVGGHVTVIAAAVLSVGGTALAALNTPKGTR